MASDSLLAKLPEPGAIVAGKYEIVEVVGKGGMGVVFEAIHKRLQQRVAIKMLYPHVRADPDSVERFEREARAAGQLLSPNIARILDVETNTELPYIVMEFLEGNDLDDEIEKFGQLPITTAVDYILQACAGMREAHALGIIHRDLKPANLFLCQTPDGPTVKILDFGISKITTEVDARLTAAMTTMGSPIYMSPEQLREARHVDQRADIWGLGVILYELIAGRPPFDGSVTVVTASIIADKPPALSSLCQSATPALDAVLMKALEKDPDKRWRDAEELAEALVPFASPEAVKRLRASLMQPTPTPRSFRRPNVPSADDDPAATMARPSALPPVTDTRHSFSASELARAIRPRSKWRSRLIVAAGVLVPIAVVVAVAVRGNATPAPVAASAAVTAVDAAEPSAAPATIAAPIKAGEGEPTASPNVVAAPAATTTSTTASTSAPPSAPPMKHSSAGAAHAAPAATKNPLHL